MNQYLQDKSKKKRKKKHKKHGRKKKKKAASQSDSELDWRPWSVSVSSSLPTVHQKQIVSLLKRVPSTSKRQQDTHRLVNAAALHPSWCTTLHRFSSPCLFVFFLGDFFFIWFLLFATRGLEWIPCILFFIITAPLDTLVRSVRLESGPPLYTGGPVLLFGSLLLF